MNLPSLNQLNPHTLGRLERSRPGHSAPVDAPAYTGAPWRLVFEEQQIERRDGEVDVCVGVTLSNQAPGYANARDGSQRALTDALSEKFAAAFEKPWELRDSGWKTVCSDPTRSFGEWRFCATERALNAAMEGVDQASRIPGGTTEAFLRLAFGVATRALPVELAGVEYTWKRDSSVPNQEGQRVSWLLTKPEGVQGVLGAARQMLGR
jgi:hypothetical protein